MQVEDAPACYLACSRVPAAGERTQVWQPRYSQRQLPGVLRGRWNPTACIAVVASNYGPLYQLRALDGGPAETAP